MCCSALPQEKEWEQCEYEMGGAPLAPPDDAAEMWTGRLSDGAAAALLERLQQTLQSGAQASFAAPPVVPHAAALFSPATLHARRALGGV